MFLRLLFPEFNLGVIQLLLLHRKLRDAPKNPQSREADETLPEEEELVELLLLVLMNGVSGMLMVGMVAGVMVERTGDDKSKDAAEGQCRSGAPTLLQRAEDVSDVLYGAKNYVK